MQRITLFGQYFLDVLKQTHYLHILIFLYEMQNIDISNYFKYKWYAYIFTNIETLIYDNSYIINICNLSDKYRVIFLNNELSYILRKSNETSYININY
jgi:hypothetical protein